MWEWGAIREERAAEADGGGRALCAGGPDADAADVEAFELIIVRVEVTVKQKFPSQCTVRFVSSKTTI